MPRPRKADIRHNFERMPLSPTGELRRLLDKYEDCPGIASDLYALIREHEATPPTRRLTLEDRVGQRHVDLWRRYKRREPVATLAAEFGVTTTRIYQIAAKVEALSWDYEEDRRAG